MPRFCGVTSSSSTSLPGLAGAARAMAWMAAPSATTSSGWTPLQGSLPKNSRTARCTRGIRVMPPTRITSSTWLDRTPASLSVFSVTAMHRSTRSLVSSSSFSRVSCLVRWSAAFPSPAAARKGRWMSAVRGAGELALGLLRRVAEPLQRHLVLAQVDAAVLLGEVEGEPVHDAAVEVLAAEVGVAADGDHVVDALADVEHRDVEGAAAEVEDHHLLLELLAEAIGQRGAGRLVDDAQHLEPGDAAGVLGGLPLAVVEVGRDGDDGAGDRAAEPGLGVGLQLGQHLGGDLGHRDRLATEHHPDVVPLRGRPPARRGGPGGRPPPPWSPSAGR